MLFPERITIATHSISIVPRYVETDKAGVIHHSVYPIWFEMGRTELLRVNGLAYKDLEEAGILFVVAELNIKFRQPAHYDRALILETRCDGVTGSRARHSYVLTDQPTQHVIAEADTVLACVDTNGKLRRMPSFMHFATS